MPLAAALATVGASGKPLLPYQAILAALSGQGTPADGPTQAWLAANYVPGMPFAVLKDSTGSAGAKLRGTGNVLAWWGDGTSTTTALTGSDTDVGKSGVAATARGIILLGNVTEWRASAAYGNAYTLTRMPTSLTYLHLYSTGVSGDITAVSSLTSLTYLHLGGTGVSGDITAVSSLTSLMYLYLYSTGVSGATSPTINSIPSLATCSLSSDSLPQVAVDTILSDAVDSLSLGGRVTCALGLSGNAAPSAAGLNDKATLVSAGWTVTTA